MMKNVKGKYIWIVGASSGIGAALAKELAANGAHVALSARSLDKLKDVESTLTGDGHLTIQADVDDYHALETAKSEILSEYPRIDSTLFMAVSYTPHDGHKKPLELVHQNIQTNIGGAYNLLYAIEEQYLNQGFGQYVICASVAGYRGLPLGQPYCATKAALINLGESWKVEYEDKGIDIKIICPGFVRTPLTDKNNFVMPMIIEPEDAAKALVKGLCSSAFEIHFPKRFTYLMKVIKILPHWIYFKLARPMKDRA